MDDEQYVYVTAALTLQENLLRNVFTMILAGRPPAAVAAKGDELRRMLSVMHVSEEAAAASDAALEIQREVLRQFDLFWVRLLAGVEETNAGLPRGTRPG